MDIFDWGPHYHSSFHNIKSPPINDNKVGLMFSGGVDSLYLLQWFLENTEYELHAFFHIRNRTEKTVILPKVLEMVDFYKKYRYIHTYEFEQNRFFVSNQTTPLVRHVQIYQGLLPALFGMGIKTVYYGVSRCDVESGTEGLYPGNLLTDVAKFWNLDVDFERGKDKFKFCGESHWDYWESFMNDLGKVYQTYYKLDWHPVMRMTPDDIRVTRQEQYEYIDREIIQDVILNCNHTIEDIENFERNNYICRCHIHYFNLHKLGVI